MAGCTVKFEHFAALLTAVMILWLYRCVVINDCPETILSRLKSSTAPNNKLGKPGLNAVSYLYIVGVEGVGHHGVSPAIAQIARACKRTVVYEYKPLRRSHKFQNKRKFSLNMKKLHRMYSSTRQIQVIEDGSFPAERNRRNGTAEQKKKYHPYNLEWLYDQLKRDKERDKGVDMKFLYLTRDFYQTVASNPEFDGSFEQHANVLHDFIWYLHGEYQLIKAKEPNIWRQMSYEWFTDMKNCTALVSSIVHFAGWSNCDLSLACARLNETIIQPRRKDINETELAYVRTMDTVLPIPFLDYESYT